LIGSDFYRQAAEQALVKVLGKERAQPISQRNTQIVSELSKDEIWQLSTPQNIKVVMLNIIEKSSRLPKKFIHYFDDAKTHTDAAKASGYFNTKEVSPTPNYRICDHFRKLAKQLLSPQQQAKLNIAIAEALAQKKPQTALAYQHEAFTLLTKNVDPYALESSGLLEIVKLIEMLQTNAVFLETLQMSVDATNLRESALQLYTTINTVLQSGDINVLNQQLPDILKQTLTTVTGNTNQEPCPTYDKEIALMTQTFGPIQAIFSLISQLEDYAKKLAKEGGAAKSQAINNFATLLKNEAQVYLPAQSTTTEPLATRINQFILHAQQKIETELQNPASPLCQQRKLSGQLWAFFIRGIARILGVAWGMSNTEKYLLRTKQHLQKYACSTNAGIFKQPQPATNSVSAVAASSS